MKNPCLEIDDKQWQTFGYDTEHACQLCGKKPAKSGPHFCYIACRDCSKLSPVRFSEAIWRKWDS